MFKSLINLLFPRVCLGCDAFLTSNEDVLCTKCRHELPLTNYHLEAENELIKKFYGRIDLQFGASMVYYHKRGIVHGLIHNLKYYKHQEIGTFLGNWYAEDLKTLPIATTFDAIIPVPLHKKRLRERGYNQVETFGKALSENLKIAYDDTILVRNIYSKTQTQKNFLGRTDVKQDIFGVNFTEENHGKHFLLIDDVITTGSTLEACARALQKIPASKLSIISIADTHNMGF
ncbi:ComF family protein [uncultured Flavobacterium sp.]|uniref:ComF family protein n=1 Tax=uncultured Flavobacterium sp. TaxID=165435 RepID=UPI0025E881E2|nr:phosphoribosyltransferase family protein [uncultured Flavobacterium sp.]